MAPEMLGIFSNQVIHGRSIDVWAAGVTLYYMKTNEYPFDGKTLPNVREQLKQHKLDLSKIKN